MALSLILSTALLTALPAPCSWAHPGANPYRGDPVRALDDYTMPDETRRQLRAMMRGHRYTDLATITRDDIAGAGGYGDLRDMHSGGGQLCRGGVDRSAWSATQQERALVYCAGDTCVIVPNVCNNVALVTRRPAAEDEPIDIEPAAGPPATMAAESPAALPVDFDPLAFLLPADAVPVEGGPGSPGGGGGGFPGLPGGGSPGGGGTGCCIAGPGTPGPPRPPITPGGPVGAIPEPPVWLLLLAGVARLVTRRR